MFLKRLELFGFKSFAEKTELEFTPGICAIVGPNGCGKSNLVDAVRWALGEQSIKLLRGAKMEEIIFGGTDSRKALNYAEVSLTFAHVDSLLDLDYEEVTVTRKLYRSGESEYLINKRPCRLKDILELFVDTGVGRDIYSFIAQGKVEEIINTRAEERRELFEEAAGILKYKNRKREAQRRLEEMHSNLIRVQDLVLELGSQLEPLAEQSSKAQHYKKLQSKLMSIEKKLLLQNFNDVRSNYNKLVNRLEDLEQQILQINTSLVKAEAASGKIKNEEQELALKRNDAERLLISITADVEQRENEIQISEERLDEVRKQLEEKESAGNALREKIKEAEKQKENCRHELEEKNNTEAKEKLKHESLKEELRELEDRTVDGETFEQLQERLKEISIKKAAKEQLLENLHKEEVRQIEQQQLIEKFLQEIDKELGETMGKKLEKEKTAADFKRELHALKTEKERYNNQFAEIENSFDNLQQKSHFILEQIQDFRGRRSILKEQEEQYSGYYQGVRNILQEQEKNELLKGIFGPVARLIKVPWKYEIAIEAALGGALQDIVTTDEAVAKRAINFLKKTKGGRATFLPLNIIKARTQKIKRPRPENPNVVGIAAELVETEPLFMPVVEFLLGNIIVASDMDAALDIGHELGFSRRIVTLQGEIINPGGAITGGSIYRHKNSMLLGRKREINALESRLKDLEEQLERLQNEIAAYCTQKDKLSERKEMLDRLIQTKEKDLLAVRQKIAELEREHSNQQLKLTHAQQEHRALTESLQKIKVEERILLSELKKLEQDERSLQEKSEKLRQSDADRLQHIKVLERKISDCRVTLASLAEKKNNIKDNLDRVEEVHNQLLNEEQNLQNSISALKSRIESLQSSLKQKKELLKDKQKQQSEQEKKLYQLTEQHKIIKEKLSSVEEEVNTLQQDKVKLEQRKHRAEIKATKLEAELRYLETKLKENYN
ncbi:MAG: chromosome segregation protein SMC, partial [Firmicutes bacterium]|nr:chromosome segregation protein SMC [Bacillota bacterium]